MKQRTFLFVLLMLSTLTASAYDAKIDGIYYNLDSNSKEAIVTFMSDWSVDNQNAYTGMVVIPATVTYNENTYSVTAIGESAFKGCSGLTSIEIPNSVTSIGYEAFYRCSSLSEFTMPNSVTAIGEYAFDGTAWYNNQPEGVVYAGNVAYKYKGTMPENTSVSFKEGTVGIANSAFESCSKLLSVIIPSTVKVIGKEAFYGCSSMISIVVDAGNTVYDSRNNCNAIIETATNTLIFGCNNTVIPNSVIAIGIDACSGYKGLAEINVPNSVTYIGDHAFYGTGWYEKQPDGLIYAGNIAYDYKGTMPENTSISIKEGTVCIAGSAFESCTGLKKITIPNSVTSIVAYAFKGCSGLTSVTIPNSVTLIERCAFQNCSALTSIEIPNSVTSLGEYAFSSCSGLTSVTIPNSVTEIGKSTFYKCSNLTSVTIPNGVTSIGGSAFEGCKGLTSMTIGSGVKLIGKNAFADCTGELTVNCNIPSASNYVSGPFYGSKFSSVKIGDGVESIGDMAFLDCSCLTSVEIPSSMTSIGLGAFAGCSGLKSVTCEAKSVPSTGNYAFADVPQSSATLYVSASALENYKATEQWSKFGTIAAIPDAGLRGDANGDGEIGMPDVMFVVNYILGNPAETFNAEAADANQDGEIGMPDVMFIVNYILNGKFPDEE